MRDAKSTIGESDVISVSVYSNIEKDSDKTLFDITKYIPARSIYTHKAIVSGLYELDELIQYNLSSSLKWETIFHIFSKISASNQQELICGTTGDTNIEEEILNEVSKFLIGRSFPTYGTSKDEAESWKLFIEAALDKYSR